MHPQYTNIPLPGLDRCALTVGAMSGPTAKLKASFGAISTQSWIYMVKKKHSGKAEQLTLASGGSENA